LETSQFFFNRQIAPVRPEQDNNSNAAIIEFAKICLDEIVKYDFLFFFSREGMRRNAKRRKLQEI